MAYGGREFTERRAAEARKRFGSVADIGMFGGGLIVIVLGALLLAEGVAGTVTNSTIFFEGVNRGFEGVVGFIAVILGASLIPRPKSPSA